jgi:hypothetical protein
MFTAAHLAELERRHRALQVEARAHPSTDNLQIVALKRRKMGARAAPGVGDRDKEICGKTRAIHLHQKSWP